MAPRAPSFQHHNRRPVQAMHRVAPIAVPRRTLGLRRPIGRLARPRQVVPMRVERHGQTLPLQISPHKNQQPYRRAAEQHPLQQSSQPRNGRAQAARAFPQSSPPQPELCHLAVKPGLLLHSRKLRPRQNAIRILPRGCKLSALGRRLRIVAHHLIDPRRRIPHQLAPWLLLRFFRLLKRVPQPLPSDLKRPTSHPRHIDDALILANFCRIARRCSRIAGLH